MMKQWMKCFALAAFAACAAGAAAQGFPSKQVRIIVPQAPGGASDALSRIIAAKLGEKWGQQVVVENRAGAGGNIGTAEAAKAPADGHTLLLGYIGTHAINPSLYHNLTWDPIRDFAPVATLAAVPFVVVVNPSLAANTTQELIASARAADGKLTYSSAGNGSVNHLLGEMFDSAAGVKMTHVPYKGAGPALADLIGGQVQVSFTSMPSVIGHIKGGKLRAIAVTSRARSDTMPELPTLAESGLPGFDVNPWFGLLAPAATPAAIVSQLNREVNDLLASADVRARFASQGAVPLATSPAEFAALLKQDIEKWAKVVKDSGAKID
jgi:tripartite-type tricarboxylate transporter receptor subunit TctC